MMKASSPAPTAAHRWSWMAKSKAGQAFINIARRLNGEEVPFMTMEDESGILWPDGAPDSARRR